MFVEILALGITTVGVVASVADMSDEGRARLLLWSKSAYKFCSIIFILVSLINGIIGVILFYAASNPPSRHDILVLVLFLLNIQIGISGLSRLANHRQRNTNQTIKK